MREHMGVVKMVFQDCLDNIDALFAIEYVDLVDSEQNQDDLQHYAAEGPHFRIKCVLPALNTHFKCLTELVLTEKKFSQVAMFVFTLFFHQIFKYH